MTSSHRYIGLQLVAKVIAAGTLVLMARMAGATSTGGFIFGTAVAGAASLFLDWGRSKALVRVVSAHGSPDGARALVVGVSRRARIAVILGCIGLPFASGGPVTLLVALITGAVLCMNALSESILLGDGAGGVAATGNLVSNVVALSALLASIGLGYTTSAELLATYLAGAIGATIYYGLCQARATTAVAAVNPWLVRPASGPPASEFAEDLIDARHSGLLMLSTFLYFRADVLLLAALVSPALLAEYGTGYRFVEICITLLQLIAAARQPTVAKEVLRRGASAAAAVADTYVVMSLASAAMSLAVIAVGPTVYVDLFGHELAGGSELVALLALVVPGHGLIITANLLLFVAAKGTTDRAFVRAVALVTVATMITAILIGDTVAGLKGVAYGEAAAEAIVGLGLGMTMLRRLDLERPRTPMVAASLVVLMAPLAVESSAPWRVSGCIAMAAVAIAAWGRRAREAAIAW